MVSVEERGHGDHNPSFDGLECPPLPTVVPTMSFVQCWFCSTFPNVNTHSKNTSADLQPNKYTRHARTELNGKWATTPSPQSRELRVHVPDPSAPSETHPSYLRSASTHRSTGLGSVSLEKGQAHLRLRQRGFRYTTSLGHVKSLRTGGLSDYLRLPKKHVQLTRR